MSSVEISSVTIDYSQTNDILDEITKKSYIFYEENGKTPDIVYLDGETYLKVFYYMKSNLLLTNDVLYGKREFLISGPFGYMIIQVVPFKKCIKVGYRDQEREAIRLLQQFKSN